ncbi:Calx-beta domain-containing protein [Falsiroseomonas sp. E2-1-a20]|uniref:Calx-beta domain-containing protein n=1 Tax=Falsiroseomonas sp. E2-1-a20 TaxID=3239300 RepID=UPI003F2DCA06
MSMASTPNVINGTSGAEDLLGTGGYDSISGFSGNDRLYGRGGNDFLSGGAGNDRLDGGTGADTMLGGSGNDVYVVDSVGDVVSEENSPGVDSGGVDTVQSWISYSLGAFVERLELLGTADLDGVGNALGNALRGNAGSNVLFGGAGVDTLYGFDGDDILIGGADKDYLYGGAGADTFVLGLNDGAADVVYDFEAIDRIGIYAGVFGLTEGAGLSGGQLDGAYFVAGSAATASGHGQFIFTSGSKPALKWDPDGIGGQGAVTLATFSSGIVLTAEQMHVLTAPTASAAAAVPGPQSEDMGTVYFTLTLSQPWYQDVVLSVSTVNGTAQAGTDFVGLSNVQVTIAAGATTAYVGVTVMDDGVLEAIETFSLRIDSATIAGGGTALAVGDGTASLALTDPAPSVVAIHNLWQYGIPDPSGIAYNPLTGKLIISDAEIEEEPTFNPISIYTFDLDGGAPLSSYTPRYSDEPTGLAIDAGRGVMYVSDDDNSAIHVTNLTDPSRRIWSFDAESLGADDPEDVAVDPVTHNLFIVNGLSRTLQEVSVDHAGRTAALVDSFTFSDSRIIDPEALAYVPEYDVFLVGGGFGSNIWVVDRQGDTLEMLTLLQDYRNTQTDVAAGTIRTSVKDIEVAPASDGSGATHIYVADFGASHKMDGRLIEIAPGNLFSDFLIA